MSLPPDYTKKSIKCDKWFVENLGITELLVPVKEVRPLDRSLVVFIPGTVRAALFVERMVVAFYLVLLFISPAIR